MSIFHEHEGRQFYLGKRSPDPIHRATFRDSSEVIQDVPKSEYRTFGRRKLWGIDWLLNQKSHGSCTGFSIATGLMRALALSGHDFVRLSGAFIYSLVNGGQDNGAIISRAFQAVTDIGTCLEVTAPWDAIYPNRYPAAAREEAKRFGVFEAWRANSFANLCSGITDNCIGICAVQVGNNFLRTDGNGVAGFDNGPGNHAVCVDDIVKLPDGTIVLDNPQTWGVDGVGIDGRLFLTDRHVESVEQDAWLMRAVRIDPLAPNAPAATS